MNKEKDKQYKARNVLTKSLVKSTLAASLLLSGFAGAVGTTGAISDFSVVQVAEAASEQKVLNVIEVGANHSLGISSDGYVYTWGWNQFGSLGDGTTVDKGTPTKVNGLFNVVRLVAGTNINFAITSDDSVYAWGHNSSGQLGDGTTTQRNTPTKINGLSNVVAIEAGHDHSLAIAFDGSVYAWGDNKKGQLGDGTITQRNKPTKVNGLSNVVMVEAGQQYSLAITSDGSVYAWGLNDKGQLGDGTITQKTTPTKINGLSDVVSVHAGSNHSLALTSDGSIYAWGSNDKGQLGDGTTTDKRTPTKINGLSNVVAVNVGNFYSLAMTSDGSVYAWGSNSLGQLGDGTTTDKRTPTKINGLSNVVEVQAGSAHIIAMTSEGNVYAWGFNGFGQLGDGTITNTTKPTLLVDIKAGSGTDPTLEEQIASATTFVVKAEDSKLQADVTTAKGLVNALPDITEKTNLTNRLNTVQKAIDDAIALATQITAATTSVVKAEGSKLQADVTSAEALVNVLPTGKEKTNLENRLSNLQDTIDASTVSYEEAMAELVDMKTYLLTGDGTREDVLAMKDALNVIHDDSASLLNESHRTEVEHYVQDVAEIIGLLEIIWDKIASGELAGLDELVSQLPESELKDNTQQEVENAKDVELDTILVEATASVEKAEQSKLQADVDASRSLVNGLSDGSEKASLTERLDAVQKGIDDAKTLAEQITKANASVKKAETSKLQADIDSARVLVEELQNGSEKTNLTERLDAITVSLEGAEQLKEAQDAVDNLNDQSTKEQITKAKDLVVKLPASSTKTELNDRITKIELNQKAVNAVVQAEKMQTNYNITLAEKAINQLSDGPLKSELTERIEQLKLTLDAESKVKSAELTKRDPYITDAMDSINKLNSSIKKTELLNRIKVIQDALSAEAEANLLEEATKYVVLAEQHKREPYLTSAKDLVAKLQDGADKTALETRLKSITDAAPVTPENPAVDPALLKAAEVQVSYAERYKRDPYLTRAQEAVNKLPTSEVKTALEERLNVIFSGASEQIEATKLKTATDSVAKAETASDLVVIEEARSLVNGLKDGEAKQALVDRLDTIEVTESMQFAYDLKVEIDAVTDATIKKVLQEAYTAVGVAKDRQTTTYMTKASTNIKALSQYEETHSEVIEKLATFFTNMQEEIEMQKLITAADKAVELSEKYQRATYYTKAQAAIDGLSKGKAKADLQARLDAAKS